VFVPPKIRGIELDLDVKLREAVKIVSRSATLNLMHPTLSGITLVFGEKKLTLFGTDNVSVARVVENHRVSKLSGKSFVLPPRFYELLLGIGANTKIVFTTGGDVIGVSDEAQLFGKLIGDPEPDRYEKMILSSKLDEIPKADVPASLARCLQRSLIASQKEDVEFSYADGRLNLLAKDQGIEIRDSVKIDLGEEPIKVYTCAEYVLRYLDVAKRIGISDRCIVLEGDNFQVLVGVKAEG
jgi:DNA polymerase III sliding clamp (beta) subunit (PCNA family)